MPGIVATLGVAGVVCCVACTAGDVCNDLKTGYLVGASPRNQQIMQVLGVIVAAFVMAPVMTVLHEGSLNAGTGGIGGEELSAPQAGLFAALVKGFFAEDGNLPQGMVALGVGIGVLLLLADRVLVALKSPFRLHVMPVAVGIYLPFRLSGPILLGGLVRWFVSRREPSSNETLTQRGVLMASGIIAGESLVGVMLGILAYAGVTMFAGGDFLARFYGLSTTWREVVLQVVSLSALLAVSAWVYIAATRRKRHSDS
jgi:putative OPT family oligopeptide transporter